MPTNHLSHVRSWQHTLAGEFSCVGRGLHSGRQVRMRVRPAAPGTGIRFLRLDVDARQRTVVAHWRNVVDSELCTMLANEHGVNVHTIEHLLAALHGCEIDNAMIELNGPEVPIMDGSAVPFVALLRRMGRVRQPAAQRAVLVREPVAVADGDRFALLLPDPRPRITVEIDFPNPVIGHQRYSTELDAGVFAREIAPARTFGFARELRALHSRGLALGGTLRSAILVDEQRVVNEEGLRFPDEFVRHKLLDCIGDLALLGMPVIGHLVAHRPGHRLCHQLLRALDAAGDTVRLVVPGLDGRHTDADTSEPAAPTGNTVRSAPGHGGRS